MKQKQISFLWAVVFVLTFLVVLQSAYGVDPTRAPNPNRNSKRKMTDGVFDSRVAVDTKRFPATIDELKLLKNDNKNADPSFRKSENKKNWKSSNTQFVTERITADNGKTYPRTVKVTTDIEWVGHKKGNGKPTQGGTESKFWERVPNGHEEGNFIMGHIIPDKNGGNGRDYNNLTPMSADWNRKGYRTEVENPMTKVLERDKGNTHKVEFTLDYAGNTRTCDPNSITCTVTSIVKSQTFSSKNPHCRKQRSVNGGSACKLNRSPDKYANSALTNKGVGNFKPKKNSKLPGSNPSRPSTLEGNSLTIGLLGSSILSSTPARSSGKRFGRTVSSTKFYSNSKLPGSNPFRIRPSTLVGNRQTTGLRGSSMLSSTSTASRGKIFGGTVSSTNPSSNLKLLGSNPVRNRPSTLVGNKHTTGFRGSSILSSMSTSSKDKRFGQTISSTRGKLTSTGIRKPMEPNQKHITFWQSTVKGSSSNSRHSSTPSFSKNG